MFVHKYFRLAALPLLILLASRSGPADVATDLTNFVDSVGGAATSSPPRIYQGQSRGYISGGRVFARVPQRTIQPVSFRAPRFTAGCGGIDIFGGSLSFISAAELVNTLKAIGSNAGSYALMLGLRTISSQIANTMEKNFDWLQQNLGGSINSCEAAASLVSGLGGAMGINDKEKNVCIIQNMESSGNDYNEAKKFCTSGGGSKTGITTDAAREKVFVEGNLAWIIMNNGNVFPGDNDMRQMAMSLTGTIVKRQVKDVAGVETTVSGDVDSQSKTEVHPSLILTDNGLLDALLYGATVSRYVCDTTAGPFDCKEVTTGNWTLTAANSLVARTTAALMNIYNSIGNRTDPTAADFDFVVETAIPAMRIVKTAALMRENQLGIQLIEDYAELIAVELLNTWVNGIINAMSGYSFEESYGEEGAKFREGIALVKKNLSEIREAVELNSTRSLQIAEQMEHYERIIISAMPRNITRSLAWSAGGGR